MWVQRDVEQPQYKIVLCFIPVSHVHLQKAFVEIYSYKLYISASRCFVSATNFPLFWTSNQMAQEGTSVIQHSHNAPSIICLPDQSVFQTPTSWRSIQFAILNDGWKYAQYLFLASPLGPTGSNVWQTFLIKTYLFICCENICKSCTVLYNFLCHQLPSLPGHKASHPLSHCHRVPRSVATLLST